MAQKLSVGGGLYDYACSLQKINQKLKRNWKAGMNNYKCKKQMLAIGVRIENEIKLDDKNGYS